MSGASRISSDIVRPADLPRSPAQQRRPMWHQILHLKPMMVMGKKSLSVLRKGGGCKIHQMRTRGDRKFRGEEEGQMSKEKKRDPPRDPEWNNKQWRC